MNGFHYQTTKNEHEDKSMVDWIEIDSDSDSSSSTIESETNSDDGALRPSVHALGLSKTYVPDWRSEDAFREFYQNWKDAIVESFDLDPRSFKPELRETPGQIQIRVFKPETSDDGKVRKILCGFILFRKKDGILELTNFQANLDLTHLSLGGSSKRENDKFAGTHGEGLKLAALVLHRSSYSVRLTADSYYWNFGFRGRNRLFLYCRLSQVKPEKVEKQKLRYTEALHKPKFKRGLSAHVWEDVTVRIKKARGEFGRKVREEEFRLWLQMTLDVSPPSPAEVIATKYGDLILDHRFAGSTYLKGLRIPGNGNSYAFGYNFANGKVNRDRDRIANVKQEQEAILNIWQASILAEGSTIIDLYLQLLREDRDCVEVTWTCDKMEDTTVETIWDLLKSLHRGAYFYCEEVAPLNSTFDQPKLIKEELKKEPVALSERLFKLFKKFSLIQTPEEERERRFRDSPVIAVNTYFGQNIGRALVASFRINKETADIQIRFVEGGGTDQDFVFSTQPRLVKIHQKWLDFHKAHDGHFCQTLRLLQAEKVFEVDHRAFACDHAVEELLEAVLHNTYRFFGIDSSLYKSHRQLAREKLQLMPRLIQIAQTDQPRTLEVSWIGNESGLVSEKHSKNIRYVVTLHKESSCGRQWHSNIISWKVESKSNSLDPSFPLFPPTNQSNPEANSSQESNLQCNTTNLCGCDAHFVSRLQSKARFDSLDPNEKYFPMVARAETSSFFGLPPPPLAPSDTPIVVSPGPKGCERNLPSLRVAKQNVNLNCDQQPPTQVQHHAQTPNDAQLLAELRLKTLCQKDEAEWREWFKLNLPLEFFKFRAQSENNGIHCERFLVKYPCLRLGYCFEKDEYASIQLNDDKSSKYLVMIHTIIFNGPELVDTSAYLLVTKFSALQSTVLAQQRGSITSTLAPNREKEVLLHFGDFDKMGSKDDAEMIRLDTVAHASSLMTYAPHGSDHVICVEKVPEDVDGAPLFCRFGIHRSNDNTGACLTPVASHLLPRQNRWREARFPVASTPVVFDFTTGVLGPSEGFVQTGYRIGAGVGFDPERHVTWKIRHGSSQIYDGIPERVLEDLRNGFLLPPGEGLYATAPKIALMAGGNTPFRFSDQNQRMPSLEEFLSLLDKADKAIQSPLKPDFLVMISSPALLHPLAADRLAASLLVFLERRFSVHLKLCSLQDLNVPFEGDFLILVASSLCAPMTWHSQRDGNDQTGSNKIRTHIQDLAFTNVRKASDASPSFVCLRPLSEAQEDRSVTSVKTHVYNHSTGLPSSSTSLTLDWDNEMLEAMTNAPQRWKHPSRGDLLTVRELARLRGFPDDFIFYLSELTQYEDVWRSCPPAVARLVAESILRVTRSSLEAELTAETTNSRNNKRPRLNDTGSEADDLCAGASR